jgi:hypothetical protein
MINDDNEFKCFELFGSARELRKCYIMKSISVLDADVKNLFRDHASSYQL